MHMQASAATNAEECFRAAAAQRPTPDLTLRAGADQSTAHDIHLDHDPAQHPKRPVTSGSLTDVAVSTALISGGRARIRAGLSGWPLEGTGAVCRHRFACRSHGRGGGVRLGWHRRR